MLLGPCVFFLTTPYIHPGLSPPRRRLTVLSVPPGDVFNVSLHVPSLRVDEIVRVVRSLEVFELRDIPEAVEALTSATSKLVPIKKLLLWLEMAKQDVAPGQRIPLARWRQVLSDLS